MSKIKAKDVEIKLGGSKIAGLTDCSIDITTVTDDTRTKESAAGPCHEFDRIDWSASGSGEVGKEGTGQKTIADLRDAAIAGTVLEVQFAVSNSVKLKGNALISGLTITAPVEGKATYSITFQAVGPITKL